MELELESMVLEVVVVVVVESMEVESMKGWWRWIDCPLEPVVLQDLPQTDKSRFTVRVVEK